MRISGFQKLTLSDFEGLPSCIVFTQGCNFRCPFCHNPGLVPRTSSPPMMDEGEIFEYLYLRAHLLYGVVITGGEPCLQKGLLDFVRRIKDMGLMVKLDTNGSMPGMIEQLISEGLLDYVAMDIKAPKAKYAALAGCRTSIRRIQESIELLRHSSVLYEFRTTLVSPYLSEDDIVSISDWIGGSRRYVLQTFVPAVTLDPSFGTAQSFPQKAAASLCNHITQRGTPCMIR